MTRLNGQYRHSDCALDVALVTGAARLWRTSASKPPTALVGSKPSLA